MLAAGGRSHEVGTGTEDQGGAERRHARTADARGQPHTLTPSHPHTITPPPSQVSKREADAATERERKRRIDENISEEEVKRRVDIAHKMIDVQKELLATHLPTKVHRTSEETRNSSLEMLFQMTLFVSA